ncbi:T9SS type A sorting domain-containing protein [Mucilaginibacter ximonensis]|uniref:T9SS type A sorting domain-containing protein n=1 Tax=Mucilaginibacter ximonensis TaxID=538021 RepID=A0ABW5YGB9_9SPHI
MYAPKRFTFLVIILNLICLKCLAAGVTVTVPTGGIGISADKSSGSAGAAYTALGNIVLTSTASADFPVGATQTLTLKVPTNWQFQAGTGSATGGGNIMVLSTLVTSGSVVVTYTNLVASISNTLTISGLQVQATVRTILASSNITCQTGSGIAGITTTTNMGSLSQVAGAFVKMQLLVPGETAAPGTTTGKTGTPNAASAGTAFSVTVNAVDANWNVVSVTDNVTLSSTDVNATLPSSTALVNGTKTFTTAVNLRTPGTTTTITATDATDGTKTANTSPSITVNVGAYNSLLIILPGETYAPGTSTGKTSTATSPTAGTSFNISVYAVDAAYNTVTSVTDNVAITSNDVNAILPASAALSAGTITFSFTFKTATTTRNIVATDATASKTVTSSSVTVLAAAFSKLQILLPGETAAAGTTAGKTGTPTAQLAGVAFTVTVNAVDAYWNKVTTAPTDAIGITSSDVNATLPANANLASGVRTFSITLRTLGTGTVTATDATDGTKTANTSSSVTVNQGTLANLLIVMPGETFAGGTAAGKTGTPSTPVAGTAFNFSVYAVDAGNNVISTINDNIAITSTDANAALPASAALSSGTQTFNFTFKTAGSFKITATDATASKTITTATLTVIPGAFVKLQLLLPGEIAAAGTATGKTGTPTDRVSGTAFNVIVNAVDANWNRVSSVTSVNATLISDQINIISNDLAVATPVSTGTMAAGTKTISVTLKTPTTPTTLGTLQASDVTNTGITSNTSPTFNVNVGTFSKLQLLLPGETAAPNTTTGKTGTPIAQTAGTPFTITVNAVDKNWNIVNTATDVIGITSTDANAILPANAALAGGTQTFTFTFKTAGSKKITASDVTNTSRTANTSPSVTVNAGAFVKLLALAPGETLAPGTPMGKAGTPINQSAGKAFNVSVYAVDVNWNKVTTITDVINITTTDAAGVVAANAALVSGGKNFSVTLKTIGTATVTATDVTDGTKTAYTTSTITVGAGAFARLLLLMPGETSAPATTTGKTGTAITPQTAGTPFNVTVYAVDAAWNILTTPTDVVSITSSTDINAALPANAALVAGTKTFSVTFKTAGASRNVVARDVTDGTKTLNTGTSVTVVAGAYAQLQILLPGETARPGTSDGKSGAANPPARGTAFNITVNAVDAYFNLVNTITDVVTITSSDGGATLPAPTALVSGTKSMSVKIVSTSTSPLPTITATDGSISNTISVPVSVPPTAATDYFRTAVSGDWSDASIWESSTNGTTGWQNATIVPGTSASGVTILNSYNVTISSTVTAGKITINNGGTLTVTSTLNINSGGADVHGTIINSGTINPTGTLVFESDGKYQHNFTTSAGTIPAATWDSNSTCEIIGYTSYSGTIGGAGQTFGNFIWNCANQNTTGGVALGAVTASINNLTVSNTGASSSTFQLISTASATANITVKSFTQTGGNFLLSASSSATANLSITGDFNMSGGIMKTTGSNTLISFAGTSTQNFIKTGGTMSTALNFAINNNAIVDFDTNVLDGSTGTFTLNNGGTLITANDDGISSSGATGTIQSSGTRNFGTAANFVYDGANAQNAGTGLPTTINNITINNNQSVTLPATTANYTINGTLTLTAGNLDMNTNNLLTGSGFIATGAGYIRTQSTATAPVSSGKTWAVGVEYYSANAQNVVAGTYKNLSFSGFGAKTLTGNISVTGDWSSADGNIDFLTNNATAQFTGTTQTLNDDGTNGVTFGSVTFSNSGTKTMASGKFYLATSGLLTMSGSAVLAANGNLTVLSDATGTGNIGSLTAGAITGKVNIQCFVTGGGDIVNRGYRLISSPISDPAAANSYYNLSFLQGNGSYLTGPGGTANGFDATGNPTIYLYREDKTPNNTSFLAGNFRGITAINRSPAYNLNTVDSTINMPVGNGMAYFFRGNNTTVATNTPNDVTLSSTGTLNQGQIIVSPWFIGGSNLSYNASTGSSDPRNSVAGFNLVGNPYACAIDWNTAFAGTMTNGIYAPGTDQTIYIYNPQSKNYSTYLNTSSSGGTGTNGGTNIIPVSEGFFVRATSSTAQLVFNESAKVNVHPATMLNSATTTIVPQQLRLQLSKDTISKDEIAIVFNNAAHADYKVGEDALYLQGNGAVSLSNLSGDNRKLAINQMPLPKQAQSIPLNMYVSNVGSYKFIRTELSNIPAVYNIWLVDNYMRDSLDLKANNQYDFIVSADAASHSADRFKLVMKPNPALSVRLLNFTATKNTTQVKINWIAENEADYTQYILQRSTDGGKTFTVLDSLTSAGLGTYNDFDPYPVTGSNMYRIKQIDVLGNITYSNIITVMYSPPASNFIVNARISVYPNPTSNALNLTVKTGDGSSAPGYYKITVTNTSGIVVKTSSSTQADWHNDVSNLAPGTYFIEVINLKDNSLTGRTSFIKL